MFDFNTLGLAANFGLFAIAAVAVWFAGSRISHYADAISRKTGVGHAILGLLLLAGVTSLPEIAVTVSAAAAGDTQLAVNNLFGSIAMQVAILAVIDFVIVRRALTSVVPEPAVMLQGALNVLLLSIAVSGMVVGDIAFFGIGVWSWACLASYVACIWLLSRTEGRRPWLAANRERLQKEEQRAATSRADDSSTREEDEWARLSLSSLIGRTIAVAAIILVAGYVLSRSGSAIAEQTGIGSSFVGFVLVAISTSLPEFSTAYSAARLGFLTMAISDILGTNLINVGLIFLVDAVATGEPVLNQVGSFSVFGGLLSIIVTTLYVAGMAERRDQTIWRIGIDSVLVLLAYCGGVGILYTLR